MPPASQSKLYNPRHPERTLLYQTVAEHEAEGQVFRCASTDSISYIFDSTLRIIHDGFSLFLL